jgi:hypothetical protein
MVASTIVPVVMRMIAAALDIQLYDGEITGHHCQERDLLEALIGLFARRMQVQLRARLCRAYQMHGYEQTYKARTVALVYPHPPEMRNSGLQSDWLFAVSHAGFRVVTIDLTRPDEFANTLGRLIKAGTATT